MLLLADN